MFLINEFDMKCEFTIYRPWNNFDKVLASYI